MLHSAYKLHLIKAEQSPELVWTIPELYFSDVPSTAVSTAATEDIPCKQMNCVLLQPYMTLFYDHWQNYQDIATSLKQKNNFQAEHHPQWSQQSWQAHLQQLSDENQRQTWGCGTWPSCTQAKHVVLESITYCRIGLEWLAMVIVLCHIS